jgi:hypothetical protein
MNGRRGLVLDVNILIRAANAGDIGILRNVASFCSPDVCFQDARKYIPDLSERRAVYAAIGDSRSSGNRSPPLPFPPCSS